MFYLSRVSFTGTHTHTKAFANYWVAKAFVLLFIQLMVLDNAVSQYISVNLDPPLEKSPEPTCWLDSGDLCDDKIKFAPDPDFPEHTPIKYIKLIIHVFQLEDPNDPDFPGNFQNIPDHINVIRSWFDDPVYGVNSRLGNLCDDPVDFSDHMPDARFRIKFDGNVGEDLFFHQDFEAWRTGFFCGVDPNTIPGLLWAGGQLNYIYDTYVEPFGDPTDPAFDPNKFNAIHFFVTGATDAPPHLEVPAATATTVHQVPRICLDIHVATFLNHILYQGCITPI